MSGPRVVAEADRLLRLRARQTLGSTMVTIPFHEQIASLEFERSGDSAILTSHTRYPLVSLEELAALPDPVYLVAGLIPERGLVMLHGQPSAGKSLLALDWALCLATGASEWMGRALRPGRVVYVAAEGEGGLKHRVAAWVEHRGVVGAKPQFHFILIPIPLLDAATADLVLNEIYSIPGQPAPVLVVVDTLARCTPGGDENDVGDMSLAISTLDRIRQDTGGAVLLVHHNRKESKLERGSTALRGAVDVVLALSDSGGIRELEVTKHRDGEAGGKIRLRLHPEGKSAVMVPAHPEEGMDALGPSAQKALAEFRNLFTGDPVRTADWKKAVDLSDRTFQRAVADLRVKRVVQYAKGGNARGEYEPGPQFNE